MHMHTHAHTHAHTHTHTHTHTGSESTDARLRGLHRFLTRVARHPVLGSTKLLRDFLTIKDDKVSFRYKAVATAYEASLLTSTTFYWLIPQYSSYIS